ncbi:hypothetical protein [Paenibacillus solani]|uniref:hypothetical protein n=1 Tax=Paenibacillus solani TaxID=1705565 RepID=UPI003D28D822
MSSSSASIASSPVPAHYGLREDAIFPQLQVLSMDQQESMALELSRSKESVILITLLGCESCEQTLKHMKMYNLLAFEFDLSILTFLYPGVYYADDKIARHTHFLEELTASRKFIVLEESINQLEINSFPTLMRIKPDGKVVGTYLADAHQIAPHFQSSVTIKAS